jgi:hypothetical protein
MFSSVTDPDSAPQVRTIQFAGKDYDYEALPEPARQLVDALRASDAEIRGLRNQLALMDVGRRALVAQLRLALENPDAFARLQEQDLPDAERQVNS